MLGLSVLVLAVLRLLVHLSTPVPRIEPEPLSLIPRAKLADLPGVKVIPLMRQGFGSPSRKPVQLVIGGGTYAELAQWREILLGKIEESSPGLTGLDWDYKESKPQLRVEIDYDRAADLGVTLGVIGVPAATAFTLYVVPVACDLLAWRTGGCETAAGGGVGGAGLSTDEVGEGRGVVAVDAPRRIGSLFAIPRCCRLSLAQ
jgi:hypothetical protein